MSESTTNTTNTTNTTVNATTVAATRTLPLTNGTAVMGGPLTTALSDEHSPGLLLNEIDRRVTLIRPTSTPVDQISRCCGARHAGSMVVEYYSVDVRPDKAKVTKCDYGSKIGDVQTWTLEADQPVFEESETILVPSVQLIDNPAEMLMVYVMSRDETKGTLTVIPVNGTKDGDEMGDIEVGAELIRMGRAATELDVQTAQYEALPTKASNNCQIFKMQIEQSTYQKLANKEVGWSFSDQEEVAIIDMRMAMEKSFLFGAKHRLYNPRKREDVLFTGGIWYQAGREYSFDGADITEDRLIDLMRVAFTGNAGSTRKVLIGGSGLIAALNKMSHTKIVPAREVYTRWGIDFDELHSKFGSLLVKHSEVFDTCGHADCGLVIDPQYMTKYSHVPFSTERLDLRRSGIRNTDAVVVTEASCLVLRYPEAHVRVRL